jgi:DoxX-like family
MTVTIPTAIAFALTAFFALAALVNFINPSFVRNAYESWGFPPKFNRAAAMVDLAAAVFLAMPITRIWGVALAAFVTFAAEIMLINHKHYAFAVPGMVVLAALVPALLAGPI